MQSAKDVVLAFVGSLNDGDFVTARQYVHADISFEGPLATRKGADEYLKDMERIRLRFNIQKVFEDADDICLLYDVDMGKTTVYGCGWYKVQAGKIRSIKAVFDPRPVLEAASKRSVAS